MKIHIPSQEFKMGIEAAKARKPRSDNPFGKDVDLYIRWDEGWVAYMEWMGVIL